MVLCQHESTVFLKIDNVIRHATCIDVSSLEMPVPSQGHYGFHSFPVVDWFCLFIYL